MKAKLLQVAAELLVEMCKPKPGVAWRLLRQGLPLDASVSEVYTDRQNPRCFVIKIVSESWPKVEFGHPLEYVTPPVFQSTEHGIPK